MSPSRSRSQNLLGRSFHRQCKVQDRVRENSVVRTFRPLNNSFNFESPKIVVQGTTDLGDETHNLRQTKSKQRLSKKDVQRIVKNKLISNNSDNSDGRKKGKVPAWSRWHSDIIRTRLLRSVAKREGDKIILLLPLKPAYGSGGRDVGDAIRSWIRTNTRRSRWAMPDDMNEHCAIYPRRSVATQTLPIITVTSPPPSPTKPGDEDGAQCWSSSAPRWDNLLHVEMSGMVLRSSTPHKSQDLAIEGASAECAVEVRGGGQVVGAGVQQVGAGRRLPDPVEVSSVTYLSVPETPAPRRPSTADLVIQKLQVEKVEGGGLSIQGVSLASNCHVTLIVFGVFFMLAGVVLSYVSYSVTLGAGEEGSEGTEKPGPEEHLASVSQMRMIGPSFLVVGFVMLGLGITLFGLARKISRDEKVKQLVISEQQLCELESSFTYTAPSPLHTTYPAPHQQYPILAVRRNSWWVDTAPRECGTAGEPQDSAIQCPTPIEESREGTPTSMLTPVPLELLPDLSDPPTADIACFPSTSSQPGLSPDPQTPPPVPGEGGDTEEGDLEEVRSDIPILSTAAQEVRPTTTLSRISLGHAAPPRLTAEGQDIRSAMLKPPSAAQTRSYGLPVPSSAVQVPSIQVTAATPVLPPLPRLSRHHSSRPDSRPTTADSR